MLALLATFSIGLGFSVRTHDHVNGGAQFCWVLGAGILMIGIWVLIRPYHAPAVQPHGAVLAPRPRPPVAPDPPATPSAIAQAVATEPGFVDAFVTPDYLLGLYEGRLDVQAQARIQPWIGKKMRVEVSVRNVSAGQNSLWMMVSARLGDVGSSIIMYFNEAAELPAIAGLQEGDVITVVGTLERADRYQVLLDPCTLERIH